MNKNENSNQPIHSFKKYENLGLTAEDFPLKSHGVSKIIIEDLKIFAKHGVLPEENIIGTYYLINAEIEANLWKASETDDLLDTINYAEINEIIHQEMAKPSKLLENVIGRIFAQWEEKFPEIISMKIKLTKTNPPMRGEMKGVSVEMQKRKGE